jgi:hypothetical protein
MGNNIGKVLMFAVQGVGEARALARAFFIARGFTSRA